MQNVGIKCKSSNKVSINASKKCQKCLKSMLKKQFNSVNTTTQSELIVDYENE